MMRCTPPFALSTLLLCLALAACRGSFGAGLEAATDGGQDPDDSGNEGDAGTDAGQKPGKNDAGEDLVDASEPEDDSGVVVTPPEGLGLKTKISSNERFDGYLTDLEDRALYFYAGDAAGAQTSTCLTTECATEWPPFDWGTEYGKAFAALRDENALPEALKAFGYFHRDDGLWQVTYNNRPLYYYKADEGGVLVNGDDLDHTWFVARDYFVFVRTDPRISPFARSVQAPGTLYLTDGRGASIYARLAAAQVGGIAPVSVCEGECLQKWPEWAPVGDLNSLPIPSSLSRSKFSSLLRDDGLAQLAYDGYPLHRNIGDDVPGEAVGHEDGTWRLLAPSGF
jgi:predicted lipoprotein with Yx(FWY)xxD motif